MEADALAGLEMPLREAMETQRAIRRLKPDPVDDGLVLRCIELALKAPTGSNGQRWEFVVVTDAAAKQRLARQYQRVWQAVRPVAQRRIDSERLLAAVEWQVEHFAEVPVVVVACLRGYRFPVASCLPMLASSYYGSIYPSVQNLLLAARALGLGATLLTLPLWSTRRARSILGLPASVRPCCLVPLGWPLDSYGPTSRRAVGDVVHLDRFGTQPWRKSPTG